MPKISVNSIEIAYEFRGPEDGPVLVLIQGLSLSYIAWPKDLIDRLVAEGFRILMFDNRDIGHSSHLRHLGTSNIIWQVLRSKIGLRFKSPYGLNDMMQDTVDLMEALEIESAHIVGASMGGMIAQLVAINAPEKVKSLTSIMSTTGDKKLSQPSKEVRQHMMSRPASGSPEDRLAYGIKIWDLISSPGYEIDRDAIRANLIAFAERGTPADGVARQTSAIMAAPNRADALRSIDIPSLIIHGDADPLVPLAGGIDTANAIRGSKIEIIKGMAHDFPAELIPRFSALISDHVKANEKA